MSAPELALAINEQDVPRSGTRSKVIRSVTGRASMLLDFYPGYGAVT